MENIDDFKRLSEIEAEYRRYDKGPVPLFGVERPEYRDELLEAPLEVELIYVIIKDNCH